MLIESITLAQRDNNELEALIYRFRPLIRKCGRQLHIEDVREKHKRSSYRTALGM